MKAGITGLPYSGKTTLFCAVTGQSYESFAHHRDIHVGTVKVPDKRLDRLFEVFAPKKQTNATMEYFEVAGQGSGKGREMEPKVLQTLKNAESLIVIIDSFSEGADPEKDFGNIMEELIFNDLVILTNRVERIEKEIRSGKKDAGSVEKVLFDRCRDVLEHGGVLRTLDLSHEEGKLLRGFQFLTRKPILAVINISEKILGEGKAAEMEQRFLSRIGPEIGGVPCAAICAELEMEIASLGNPDERAEFLDSLGIAEPALDRLIRLSYESLGLMVFFTGGGADEVRAWAVPKGSTAVECAGAIHSDMERGFIRAETIAFDDLIASGSFKAARDKGLLRIEGKEYIVQDGDVLTIRFSV